MKSDIPAVAFWCLAAGALAVVVLLVRQQLITRALRARNATLEGRVKARDEEVRHLATVRLPALADAPHQPVLVPGLLDRRLAGTGFEQSLQDVMDLLAGVVDRAQVRADQSAKAALKASMRALQALANEQQMSISDMQDRHDNPDVLRDLLEIDHANSQFGRRAQAIAVLCGSWPGRQRASSPMTDVVRGAKSRIRDYRRVQVRTQVELAVVSRAVEPVVLAVAELLDNAARHSQPNTTVEVNLQPAHNGACIVIDDAGVGMDGPEVERATRVLSGQQVLDVTRLGDPPKFGFPVIGVLADRYGFTVSVDTRSPYGGVRAVVFLPSALLTQIETDDAYAAPPASVTPSEPAAGALPTRRPPSGAEEESLREGLRMPEPEPSHAQPQPDTEPEWLLGSTTGGLPKRRRRQPATTQPTSPPPAPAPAQGRSAEEIARRMGAFARGTRSGRATPDDDEGNPL
ncbi:ATP-binding protein [Wenjunlia vitaminophila]|uniref:histidine kinase n=1 Tax=Wenjunlia vitaminophila TaxID=76728 RepID=A0A0T6LS70_WENVI|nr:ATP-binding protein [Wenjunlia vitaminophila]KRV48955.1 ATP-binding protein [Wenjunlia vitaminophila]